MIDDDDESRVQQHRVAQLFHVLFKALSITLYLLGNLLSTGFIILFVICVLLLAADFWTVKNITGRLLVGLRWWNNQSSGTGTHGEEWVFESRPQHMEVHPRDSWVFWTALYVTPVIWGLFAIGALFSLNFKWLLVVLSALSLSSANLIGYYKCDKDAKSKIQSFIAQRF